MVFSSLYDEIGVFDPICRRCIGARLIQTFYRCYFRKGMNIAMKYSESLKKNRDFQNVYKKGKSYANRYLVMYVLENQTEVNHIGISVSKKVGNSVIRHHLTRLIRESYRLHEDMFNSGLDIVVIARSTARDISYHEVESALLHLGSLHKITNNQ